MTDDQQEPTPAEIYANVRNKALEEAAERCESFSGRAIVLTKDIPDAFLMCAFNIRRLKTEPA